VPQLEFLCDSCLSKCYRPLEDKIDSLTKDVSDLKNAVNRLTDNKQTPSIHSDLSRQGQSKPTNVTLLRDVLFSSVSRGYDVVWAAAVNKTLYFPF
jgi:hypothetical protein